MTDMEIIKQGSRVWLVTGETPDDWIPATVEQNDSVEVLIKTDYGETHRMWCSEVDSTMVRPMNGLSAEGLDDMAKLSELNQASILCNLNVRYQKNTIYTYIGSILISVNPYKKIEGLYDSDKLALYRDKDLGEHPPHVYAIANETYSCMWKREENQCVLISGESGAGKTEATKLMLRFLSDASRIKAHKTESQDNGRNTSIEKSILESGPLLEAFGNAKTVYNNNSSRFGKFIQLLFAQNGGIQGGRITDYLLEKHRVVRQNPGERNYHIFYQLLSGLEQETKDSLFLTNPKDFCYLNTTGCISDPTLNDAGDWESLVNALKVIGFKQGQCIDMQNVLAGILNLGNVKFMNAGGAQVTDLDAVDKASQLLGLESERLESVLKERTMKLRGENITSPQSVDQACDSRDSISMALYSQLFRWMISKINHKIKGPDDFHFIGILDIFGFENFETNRFEQFCINFANEKLQEFFNRHIFSLEQLEYRREEVEWCDIEWTDNSECLDLIEKNMGVLSLINEESRFPKGTDNSLLNKMHGQHQNNSYYLKPKVSGQQYGIKHYAGEVYYTITGFLEKNRDTFRDDLLTLLKDSSNDLIYDLFEKVRGNNEAAGKGRNKKATTMSGQFKQSLHSLMERLSSANPFFVRCIKPNMEKDPDNFAAGVVLNQLKYSGMLETVRVRRAGFPVRRIFQDFADRYWMVKNFKVLPNNPQDTSREVLVVIDDTMKLWKLGKTKVFMKEILEQKLEKVRLEKVNKAAVIVQATLRAVACRKRFLKMKKLIIHVQRHVKGFIARQKFRRTMRAVVMLQRIERGRKARTLFRQLLAEKRERERIRLAATIVLQKYTRGLLQRRKYKVILEKHRQLIALKEQMEREKRERIEREKREKEERERREQEEVRIAREKELEEVERQRREEEEKSAKQQKLDLEAVSRKLLTETQIEIVPTQPQILPLPPSLDEDALSPSEDDFMTSPGIENLSGKSPNFNDEPFPFYEEDSTSFIENRPKASLRESAILADLDAVLKDADDLANVDSAYSTVRKGENIMQDIYDVPNADDELNEAEQSEMERILQLEREIAALQYVAPQPEKTLFENDIFGEIDRDVGDMDLLKDLGFKELENTIDELIDTKAVKDITPLQSDEEEEQVVTQIPTMPAEEEHVYDMSPGEDSCYPQTETDSYFTDSSFSSDEDISEEGADTDTIVSSTPESHWRPTVYFHGYLYIKGGLRNQWKRRWCVLRDDMFMFFRSKQEFIKCGWLYKKTGKAGTIRGTLPRKAWQKKWFIVDDKELKYFDTDEEGAKSKGSIDIHKATEVLDEVEKENGIDIIMSSTKTHHLAAENEDEASDWFSILGKIQSGTPQDISFMEKAPANPRNASGTVDVQDIQNVNAAQLPGKQHTFVLTTAQRVHSFACESADEMHHWITMLNESKKNTAMHGGNHGSGTQGWLLRGLVERNRLTFQRRYFKLTPNTVEYYKSPTSSQKLGCLALNSLCIVTAPDEEQQKITGLWEVVVYGRKHTLRLNSKLYNDASTWYNEIQNIIDGHGDVVSRTEQLLSRFKDLENEKEIDLIYKRNPVLRQTDEPMRSPLLSLMYEQVPYRDDHFTLRDEATRLFSVLLRMETETYQSIEEEASAIQNILSSLHGIQSLQDEFYLQLIKQTAVYQTPLVTDEQRQSQLHVTSCPHYWHLIACMCCAYHPSRKVMQYLRFHLNRVIQKYPESPAAQYAGYAIDSLQRTRHRMEVPSLEEIITILELQSLVTTIYCYGGATCEIQIHSATTAGEVVEKLLRGMQLENNTNTFALFERCGSEDKAIESNTIVADVIAKFERLNGGIARNSVPQENQWILYFKLFCVFNPMQAKETSIEYLFLFEEIHEQVIHGLYPLNDEITRQLAALRIQFVKGDYKKSNWDKEIESYYPVIKMRQAYELPDKVLSPMPSPQNTISDRKNDKRGSFSLGFGDGMGTPTRKKSSTLLNSLKKRTVKRIKEEGGRDAEMNETLFKEELQDVKANIADRWYKLKGMPRETAVVEYVQLARTWPGFGSALFTVSNNEAAFGESSLTIGVASDGISVYKRGFPNILDHFTYSGMLSFGALSANQFLVQIEGRGEIMFITEQVLEIIKLMNSFRKAMVRRKR
ncbi:unconventional myosin-X-like [Styela clava]